MLFPVDLFGRPAQGDTDIAGHTVRIVNDLEAEAIALGLELALPELVELLGLADQRLLPTRLGLVDGASVVGAERMGKTEDLDRMLSALDGSIDEDRRLFSFLAFSWASCAFSEANAFCRCSAAIFAASSFVLSTVVVVMLLLQSLSPLPAPVRPDAA